jgi:PII-like signaling protein
MDFQNLEMLRIFVGEQARYGHRPLYEEIVREAKLFGLAGATVLKGVLSYGHDMQVNTSKIMELGTNLPMVIEIIDSTEKIEGFLPMIEQMVRDASARVMITRELVRAGIIE